jgi:precorrin-3B synthase
LFPSRPIAAATPGTGEKRLGENFCPGVLHAVPARDGLLMRIRVPGGLIDAAQLRAVAELSTRHADATLEITSRANIQARALRPEDVVTVAGKIAAAGLLPSALHDRVRNIVCSPIAGLDPAEILDPRPFVHELDLKLSANPVLANLHPKFSFGIFGGPRRFSHDADDLALEAASPTSFRMTVAGEAGGFTVAASEAVDRLLQAAECCIAIAWESGVSVRARRMAVIPGAIERIAAGLVPAPLPQAAAVETLLGTCAASTSDVVNIVPSVPLGRLTAAQAFRVADLADFWLADLRLAPWRGIVFGGVPREFAHTIASQLASIGLCCDGTDGFHGISACAGIAGCDAALTDVRGHAAALAQMLRSRPAPANWTINYSGCEKQCARRHGATVDLIAEPSGYTIKRRGEVAAAAVPAESVLHSVFAIHGELLHEAAAR